MATLESLVRRKKLIGQVLINLSAEYVKRVYQTPEKIDELIAERDAKGDKYFNDFQRIDKQITEMSQRFEYRVKAEIAEILRGIGSC
jgi:uncharacterized protein YdcH (DUF465 family)